MPAATSRRPVKYRNHWPRPTLANSSTMTPAPANLAPPAPVKARATRPERIQRVTRRPLSEAAGSAFVVVIGFPPESRKSSQTLTLISIYLMSMIGCGNLEKGCREMQDTSGVHVWLVLAKAFRALGAHAEESLNLSQTGLGDSDFRVLEALLHKGPLPVNTIGPKVWLTPGSISVAVDRLEKTALVKRKNTDDRRVRLVEITRPRWKRLPASCQKRSG